MFDRATCLPMRVARYPRVDFVAVSVLSGLLA
jgi:hypothetical protein